METKQNKSKKVLNIIGNVIFGILIILILIFAISNVQAKKSNGVANVFGKGYLSVLSDSMEGEKPEGATGYKGFNKGDLIFVDTSKAHSKSLKTGDIITYWSANERKIISHRCTAVFENADGTVSYRMLGDKYAAIGDYEMISNNDVLAVYTGHKWAGAGSALAWMQSSVGFFVVVVLPTILFLLVELALFVKSLMEYKTEGVPQQAATSEAIDKEALKQQILEELLKSGQIQASVPKQEEVPTTTEEEPKEQQEN